MEMTAAILRDVCTQHKLYRTPGLNDKLYLNFKGFTRIAALEPYTGLKALFLEGNALPSLEGLPHLEELKCLYVQQNCLRSLDGLESAPNLNTLNAASNSLTSLQQLAATPHLATLIAERNQLSTLAALEPLLSCMELHTLDLQGNEIEDEAVLEGIIARLPALRCLYLKGNPMVSKVASYRKAVIAACSQLTYLDDRPVTEEERGWCEAWAKGGVEAERTERARQKEAAAAKDRRNFEWLQQLRREGFRKRRAMLGLPDGDSDPYFDTLPDQRQAADAAQATSSNGEGSQDEDSWPQEPPELLAARQRLADFDAGAKGQLQQSSGGSLEDGVVYLNAVSEAQRELNSAGAAAMVAAPIRNAAAGSKNGPAWPGHGPDAAPTDSKLALLRTANQAALAAIGLSEAPPGRSSSKEGATAAVTAGNTVVLPPVTDVAPQVLAAAATAGDSPCAAQPPTSCGSWCSGGSGSESGGTAAVVNVVSEAPAREEVAMASHPPVVPGTTSRLSLFDLE